MKRFALAAGMALAAGCSGGGSSTDPADADIRVSLVGAPVTEAGSETSFSVVLNAQPKADVTIDVTSGDDTEGTVSPASLVFTRDNWNAPQTVLVTGVDDAAADGNVEFDVSLDVTSTDPTYSALELSPVKVLNLDDESAGVRVGPVAGVTTEEGGQVVVPVVLQSEPASDVLLVFGSSNPSEATTDVITLTFTPLDWNAPKNITVTGVDDPVPDGLAAYTIVFQDSFSDDPAYAGLPIAAIALANVDDDTPGILMTALAAATSENDVSTPSVEITVRLATPPSDPVTINVKSSETDEADLQDEDGVGTTVTWVSTPFTSANWNVPQSIFVIGEDVPSAVADGDQPYQVFVDSVTTVDPAYASVTRPQVNLINLDNDTPGFLISPLSGMGDETGGMMSFTIELLTQPTATVTIPLSVSDASEAVLSHDVLTFTTTTWDDGFRVWVAGVPDSIPDGNQPWFVQFGPAVTSDANYSGRKPANLSGFTLDTGVTRRAIVFDDSMGTDADDVLIARGWAVQTVATTADLENALDAATGELVVVESSSTSLPASTEDSLATWIASGKKAVVSHWDLGATMTLTTALDVSVSPYAGHRYVFPQSIGFIDMFHVQDDFPFPLAGQAVVDAGQELVPGVTGVIAGRIDSLTGPASIVATRADRVIVNGFAPDDMTGTDGDADGIADMRELYENEIAYLLKSGSPATFESLEPVRLGDTSVSTIRVVGVPSAITKATLSVHVQHPSRSEVDYFLVGPDGTRLELATALGSTGDDLGTGCKSTDGRVTWDDAATTSTMPTTVPPVVGTFKPEGAAGLATFNGRNPNGTWTLEAFDAGTSVNWGTLKCWSLHLTF